MKSDKAYRLACDIVDTHSDVIVGPTRHLTLDIANNIRIAAAEALPDYDSLAEMASEWAKNQPDSVSSSDFYKGMMYLASYLKANR